MPVQFAIASRRESHRDAGNIQRRRELLGRDLAGPSAVLNAPVYEIEGIPDRFYDSAVRGWRQIGVGVQTLKDRVLGTRVACRVVSFALCHLLPGLAQGGCRTQGARAQSRCRGA